MCYRLVFVFLSLHVATALAAESNCTANEQVIFSCAVGKMTKVVSLCASPGLTAKSGTLYYRFGAPSRIELEYPSRPNGTAQDFKHVHYSRSQAQRTEVTFAIGQHTYTVFDYFDGSESPKYTRGVRVASDGATTQETILACKGNVTSNLQRLEGKVPCDAESALAQCN